MPTLRKCFSKKLVLHGARIDSVQRCCADTPDSETPEWTTIESILKLCDQMNKTYINGQDRVEALWRTLVGDFADGSGLVANEITCPAPPQMAKHFQDYIAGNLYFSVREMTMFTAMPIARIVDLRSHVPL